MFVYVTQSGSKHDGPNLDEVFYNYEDALRSKPSSYCITRTLPNSNMVRLGIHKNNDEYSEWFQKYDDGCFVISRKEITTETKVEIITCPSCKEGFRLQNVSHKDIKTCYKCEYDSLNVQRKSHEWYKRLETAMDKVLD